MAGNGRSKIGSELEKMNSVLPEANGILKAVHEEDKKKVLFEYTLILDLKVKRGEYADF